MHTIIAGSRGYSLTPADYTYLDGLGITAVLCGCAQGPDNDGRLWAVSRGLPVALYPADWGNHGRDAGLRRNCEMAAKAEALVAFWDGISAGTKHMIGEARRVGLTVHVVTRDPFSQPETFGLRLD